jgi:chemotaxis methyl-accepting protein methylase
LRARDNDPDVVHSLRQAVSVGETYFFRQPEHFVYLNAAIAAGFSAGRFTAWSAGCATGEEAYSLAAMLLGSVPPGAQVDVLGTDLLERNLEVARAGVYGAWSQRASGPILHPLFRSLGGGRAAVLEHVRAVTRFELHNLLDPPPAGAFDLVVCRNVLVYFEPAAAARTVAHLAAAVAPGGALVFGALDLPSPPPGFRREGPAELQIFRRAPLARITPTSLAKLQAQQAPPPPRPPRAEGAVATHLRALLLLERGQSAAADALLAELSAGAPDYLPGLLERALLHVRAGRKRLAAALMREVLRRAEALPPDVDLDGPERLPARFFSATAHAFLEREGP